MAWSPKFPQGNGITKEVVGKWLGGVYPHQRKLVLSFKQKQ